MHVSEVGTHGRQLGWVLGLKPTTSTIVHLLINCHNMSKLTVKHGATSLAEYCHWQVWKQGHKLLSINRHNVFDIGRHGHPFGWVLSITMFKTNSINHCQLTVTTSWTGQCVWHCHTWPPVWQCATFKTQHKQCQPLLINSHKVSEAGTHDCQSEWTISLKLLADQQLLLQ